MTSRGPLQLLDPCPPQLSQGVQAAGHSCPAWSYAHSLSPLLHGRILLSKASGSWTTQGSPLQAERTVEGQESTSVLSVENYPALCPPKQWGSLGGHQRVLQAGSVPMTIVRVCKGRGSWGQVEAGVWGAHNRLGMSPVTEPIPAWSRVRVATLSSYWFCMALGTLSTNHGLSDAGSARARHWPHPTPDGGHYQH